MCASRAHDVGNSTTTSAPRAAISDVSSSFDGFAPDFSHESCARQSPTKRRARLKAPPRARRARPPVRHTSAYRRRVVRCVDEVRYSGEVRHLAFAQGRRRARRCRHGDCCGDRDKRDCARTCRRSRRHTMTSHAGPRSCRCAVRHEYRRLVSAPNHPSRQL